MPVLIDLDTGEALTIEVERTPVALPASLPTTPVESGLPPARTRYAGPTSIDLTIILARIPGESDSPGDVLAYIDRAASEARRMAYIIDDDVYTDLMVGQRQIERNTGTTTRRLSVVLQAVGRVSRSTAPVSFPDAAADAQDGTQGVEDGGQQAGQEAPAPGLIAGLL
jgi:hypothetical protein